MEFPALKTLGAMEHAQLVARFENKEPADLCSAGFLFCFLMHCYAFSLNDCILTNIDKEEEHNGPGKEERCANFK
jgi:4-hydroxybenzoate polyprenyltransferase